MINLESQVERNAPFKYEIHGFLCFRFPDNAKRLGGTCHTLRVVIFLRMKRETTHPHVENLCSQLRVEICFPNVVTSPNTSLTTPIHSCSLEINAWSQEPRDWRYTMRSVTKTAERRDAAARTLFFNHTKLQCDENVNQNRSRIR